MASRKTSAPPPSPLPVLPRPNLQVIKRVWGALEPWRAATDPVVLGLENIPASRPVMFVGNHTIWGLFDSCVLMMELNRRLGVVLRPLGDHVHFVVPGWSTFLQDLGVVHGSRENAAALLQGGECVLVFPGGGREVAKARGEKYQLIWKERTGFARLAVQHQAVLVPFAAVGGEEMLDIVYDADDVKRSPLGSLLDLFHVRRELLFPVATGVGPLPVPRPERLYFHFGKPVRPPKRYKDLDQAAVRIRNQCKASIESSIQLLLAQREKDPLRTFPERVKSAARHKASDLLMMAARRIVTGD